jgi:hypothetical protein
VPVRVRAACVVGSWNDENFWTSGARSPISRVVAWVFQQYQLVDKIIIERHQSKIDKDGRFGGTGRAQAGESTICVGVVLSRNVPPITRPARTDLLFYRCYSPQ